MPKSNFFVPHSNIHHNKPSTLLRMVCIFSIEVVLLSLIEFNFVFTPTAKAITGGLLHTITPTRIYDSRYSGQGPIHSFEQRTLQVNIAYIHPSTTAIFVNLTIANPVGTGSITTYSGSSGVPSSDSLNWYSGGARYVSNSTMIGVDANLNFSIYGRGTADVIIRFIWIRC